MEAALARLLDPCMGDPGDIWLKNWCCCSIKKTFIHLKQCGAYREYRAGLRETQR